MYVLCAKRNIDFPGYRSPDQCDGQSVHCAIHSVPSLRAEEYCPPSSAAQWPFLEWHIIWTSARPANLPLRAWARPLSGSSVPANDNIKDMAVYTCSSRLLLRLVRFVCTKAQMITLPSRRTNRSHFSTTAAANYTEWESALSVSIAMLTATTCTVI